MTKFEKTLKGKPRDVVVRATEIVARVQAGATAHEVGAKRMRNHRTTLSVKLGRSWRLVLEQVDRRLIPIAVRSHEDYSRGAKPR